MSISNYTWKAAEAVLIRNERQRLVRNKVITPIRRMKPQLMVKVDGKWTAGLFVNGRWI